MTFTTPRGPQRIVCLTEETTELLYLLGEQDRIVGITAYTERPPEARRDKPVVSAFVGGSVDRIRALRPDLVIGFSDVQANYARELIAAGLPVLIFNQRSIQEILEVLDTIGRIVGAQDATARLLDSYVRRLDAAAQRAARQTHRPAVYFEEWHDPMISAIRWVSELIELAGGRDVFASLSHGAASKDRHVTPALVAEAAPELILACWCGKPLDEAELRARLDPDIPALRSGQLHELPPEIILQPGPACLTDGLDLLERLIDGAR